MLPTSDADADSWCFIYSVRQRQVTTSRYKTACYQMTAFKHKQTSLLLQLTGFSFCSFLSWESNASINKWRGLIVSLFVNASTQTLPTSWCFSSSLRRFLLHLFNFRTFWGLLVIEITVEFDYTAVGGSSLQPWNCLWTQLTCREAQWDGFLSGRGGEVFERTQRTEAALCRWTRLFKFY